MNRGAEREREVSSDEAWCRVSQAGSDEWFAGGQRGAEEEDGAEAGGETSSAMLGRRREESFIASGSE